MTRRAGAVLLAAISIAFGPVGCGESSVSPTDFATEGPYITVVPTSVAVVPGRGGPLGASDEPAMRVPLAAVTNDPITITVVQVPSISVTVLLGETATITGLPPGSYTLVFTQNGTKIGEQQVIGVQPGEQIHITVVFEGGSFVMVIVIIGNPPTPPPPPPCTFDGRAVGDSLQIEGEVLSGNGNAFRLDRNGNHQNDLFDVDASAAAYRCVGQAKGNCKAALEAGAQVHVQGTFAGCTADSILITASEVKVQKP